MAIWLTVLIVTFMILAIAARVVHQGPASTEPTCLKRTTFCSLRVNKRPRYLLCWPFCELSKDSQSGFS